MRRGIFSSLLALGLALSLVLMMAALVFAGVTTVNITDPLEGAPAYASAGGTVDISYDVTVDAEPTDVNVRIEIYKGATVICDSGILVRHMDALTKSFTDTVTLSVGAAEGPYNVKVTVQDQAGGGPVSDIETDAVIVDTIAPTLDSIVWTDVDGSTDISGGDTLLFTFSEDMDTTTIDAGNIDARLPLTGIGTTYGATGLVVDWTTPAGADTLTVTLGTETDIASGDTVNPTADVTDPAGNPDATTPPGPAIIDDVSPTVTIAVSDALINEADDGGTFDVIATFSEAMDTGVTPVIAFDPDVVDSGTLTFSAGVWSAGDTVYTATYDVADINEEQADVDVSVGGARDMAGNLQDPDPTTEADLFDVDTIAPTVALTYNPDRPVKDADTLAITAIFSEGMTVSPTIAIDTTDVDLLPTAMTMGADNTIWTYDYDVPAGSDGTATVTIAGVDLAGNANEPATNNTFIIDNTIPTVTVISPDGGENWLDGTIRNITWAATDANFGATPITIEYSIDAGTSWTVIAADVENTGSYPWTVPNLNSSNCLVKVTAVDLAGNTGSDQSNSVFTITSDTIAPTVTVNSPDGGEVWQGGSTQTITWTATDDKTPTADIVIDLYYSSDGGATWTTIATGEANDGACPWTVPHIDSTQCLVKVEATDSAGNVGSDTSNKVFTISVDTVVTVDAPPAVKAGDYFVVDINISQVTDLNSGIFDIVFDSTVLAIDDITPGVDITEGLVNGTVIPVGMTTEVVAGRVRIVVDLPWLDVATGEGYLCQIRFHAIGAADTSSDIDLENDSLSDKDGNPISATWVADSINLLEYALGDANGDGVLDSSDLVKVKRMVMGLDPTTPEADLNQDGVYNALDITLMKILLMKS